LADGRRLITPASSDLWHCYTCVLLDEDQVESCKWKNGFSNLDQSSCGPFQMRKERLGTMLALWSHIYAKRWVPGKSVGVYRLDDGVKEKNLPSFE